MRETGLSEVGPQMPVQLRKDGIQMELDGFRIHLVALKAEVVPVAGLDERAHRHMRDPDAANRRDLLNVRPPRRAVRLLEDAAVFIVDGIQRRGRQRNVFRPLDVEDQLAHGQARGNPLAARRGVARTVVDADADAALAALGTGKPEAVPPRLGIGMPDVRRNVRDALGPRRRRVGQREDRGRIDPHLRHPLEVADNAVLRHLRAHPVPPHPHAGGRRRIAKDRLRRRNLG